MSRRVFVLTASLGLLLAGSLAAVPAVLGGGGCHGPQPGDVHTDGTASTIRMDTCSFGPTVARVAVGTEVTFLNTAQLDHVVTGRGQTWGSATLAPGQQFVQRFTEPGIFPYSCPLHPGMVGAIVVGDGELVPAAAVGPDGADAAAAAGTAPPTGAGHGIDPVVAVGVGGASGLAVLALGILLARRRDAAAVSGG